MTKPQYSTCPAKRPDDDRAVLVPHVEIRQWVQYLTEVMERTPSVDRMRGAGA